MNLNDLIISLDKADEEDRYELREIANNFRKVGDLYDQLAKEEITEEEIEEIMGKIFVLAVKLKGMI